MGQCSGAFGAAHPTDCTECLFGAASEIASMTLLKTHKWAHGEFPNGCTDAMFLMRFIAMSPLQLTVRTLCTQEGGVVVMCGIAP